MSHLKPLFKWSGGKSDEIDKFKKYIPDLSNMVYIEPFIGSGAVYFHLNPNKAIINDVHKELIDFYQSIKNGQINKIYEFMESHKNNEIEYYNVRDHLNIENQLDSACKFYYLRKTCFRGMLRYNKKGEFNIPYGRYKTCNFELLKDKRYEELLKRTTILNQDYKEIFKKYNNSDNFIFIDQPYDSKFTDYGYCKFDRDEQIKLNEIFKETDNNCLMVVGKTEFIESLYKDYIVDEYDKKYKFKIKDGRVGNEINNKHLIICNYEFVED